MAGFFRGPGLGGEGGGVGGEDAAFVLAVFFFPAALPRLAVGSGRGSAKSSSWGRLTLWLAFAPVRDRVPPRGFARVPFADFFAVPDRAFTFAVLLRDAFAKRSLLFANSAV